MKRVLPSIVLALGAVLAVPAVAWADEPPPTKEQLDAAKKAFEEGNALYKAGKLPEAIEKLKDSYRLSRNAFLLYNIGHIYDQLGQRDMVLLYFKKFQGAAPPDAPMRPEVNKRVAEIEKENRDSVNIDEATPPEASKYSQADFKHEAVTSAPPGTAYDINATFPEDPEVKPTLFFRVSGDATFTSRPMTWRNGQLAARIPAAKLTGHSLQYYIEVRDKIGKLIARSGKSISPNLVMIEAGTPTHYDPAVNDGEPVTIAVKQDDIALHGGGFEAGAAAAPVDHGPRTFNTLKWITTGTTAALFGTSVVTYILAGHEHDKLVSDASSCGAPPCRVFDADYDHALEQRGQNFNAIYKVTLVIGVVTAGAAGYLWYRSARAKKTADKSDAGAVVVAPAIDHHFAGLAAAVRF